MLISNPYPSVQGAISGGWALVLIAIAQLNKALWSRLQTEHSALLFSHAGATFHNW